MSNGLQQHDETLLFEEFRLDRSEGLSRLHDSGRWDPVVIGSRAVDILRVLAERRGQLATKQALMDAVWPGIAVEDANLTVQVSALRRVLDLGRAGGSCIQTVSGRGYRFVPSVTTLEADRAPAWSSLPAEAPVPGSRPRLSIIVSPFTSLGADKEVRRLANAITENLTTDLSRLPDAFVVVDVPVPAHKLRARGAGEASGANYMIKGGIRGSAIKTEVHMRLIDVKSNSHIWAERFEIDINGIENAHEDITGRLVGIVYLKLTEDMNRRIEAVPRDDWTPADLLIHGRALAARPVSLQVRRDAMACFEQALAIDPGSVGARFYVAAVLIANILEGWSQSVRQEDMARADALLSDVLQRDNNNSFAHTYMGMLRRMQGRLSNSRAELEIALELHPNNALALYQLGFTLAYLGRPGEAVPRIERCLRLAPHDNQTAIIQSHMGLCELLLGQIEQAIGYLRKARASNPRLYYVHMLLAAALGLRGDLVEAGDSLREALATRPDIGSRSYLNAMLTTTSPDFVKLYWKTVYAGLLLAGLPPAAGNLAPSPGHAEETVL